MVQTPSCPTQNMSSPFEARTCLQRIKLKKLIYCLYIKMNNYKYIHNQIVQQTSKASLKIFKYSEKYKENKFCLVINQLSG